jgi:hypothetical protein
VRASPQRTLQYVHDGEEEAQRCDEDEDDEYEREKLREVSIEEVDDSWDAYEEEENNLVAVA